MSTGKIVGVVVTVFLFFLLDTSSLITREYHNLKNEGQIRGFLSKKSLSEGVEKVQNAQAEVRAASGVNQSRQTQQKKTSPNDTSVTQVLERFDEKLGSRTKQLQQNMENSFQKFTDMFKNLVSRFNKTLPRQLSSLDTSTNIPQPKQMMNQQKDSPQHDITECPSNYLNWKKNKALNKSTNNSQELSALEKVLCRSLDKQLPKCNITELRGVLRVQEEDVAHEWLKENELSFVHQGGWWSPPQGCFPIQSTLIVIPFRDRNAQLPILLRHLHPILRRQQLHYRIVIVEQSGKGPFNRAKLSNIGYVEGLKMYPYDCLVIHDVDLVPENDHIDYSCSQSPKHLSAAVSTFKYQLPYANIFGGVSSLSSKHFQQINGFSNLFYGWGGEDDNLFERLKKNKLKVHRQSLVIARYKMLKHAKYRPPGSEQAQLNRKLGESNKHITEDGLNTLQYQLLGVEEKLLYTLIKVDLRKEKENFLF